ncbi:MAG: hypothetical protein SP4CHLAM5_12100 [Chlamydiia bacterium]|nr:hypothetical protein [Chlamydiia bacterium]MCH9619064.1 hypothetical protein [Chlamydiia bacterium]MCH9624720.1 hypothetical protein [Chlamydiia bacterium]
MIVGAPLSSVNRLQRPLFDENQNSPNNGFDEIFLQITAIKDTALKKITPLARKAIADLFEVFDRKRMAQDIKYNSRRAILNINAIKKCRGNCIKVAAARYHFVNKNFLASSSHAISDKISAWNDFLALLEDNQLDEKTPLDKIRRVSDEAIRVIQSIIAFSSI